MKYSGFFALFFKEIKSYVYSLSSYVFIIVFLTLSSWIFFQNFFVVRQASMRGFFVLLPWFFLFLIPALSMKVWSEEKKQGTYETLLTLPLAEWQLVYAKFFAGFIFIGLVLFFSIPIPITLGYLGDIDTRVIIFSYAGAWLLAGANYALGETISSITKNQIVAFLVSISFIAFFLFIGLPAVLPRIGVLGTFFARLSTITHYENFIKGIIDLRDIVYYFSFILCFLSLNTYFLIRRHWK